MREWVNAHYLSTSVTVLVLLMTAIIRDVQIYECKTLSQKINNNFKMERKWPEVRTLVGKLW